MRQDPDWLQRRASLSPDKVALIDTLNGNREITYREWNRQANQTAHFLRERLELGKGDRLAVLSKNCIEYLDVWFALGKLGGILQNLNWRLAPAELAAIIADAAPQALVYSTEFAATVQELANTLPRQPVLASIEGDEAMGAIPLAERQGYPATELPAVGVGPEDAWVICYTGGTTGQPKGALLSYRAITANAANTIVSWGLSPGDVTILNSPLFHTGGLNVFTAPLVYLGGSSIVCREFDLEQTFHLLESGKVTIWFGVPTMFILMQSHPRWEKADFSHLRFIISGGAPCPLIVFERFWAKGVDFKSGYGLTEAGPNTFWLPREQVKTKPGAVGYPLFHVDVRLVNGQDEDLGEGETGELLIRGPHLFSGYWNNPGATEEAMRGGWLHTGDLASFDRDGAFTIAGRLKEMIISGGENVYPAEIESVLHAHPQVAEAAVIGVPDEKWGEAGLAVVVLRPGAQTNDTELLEFSARRLARYKLPRRIVFVEALPKTAVNKVDKKALLDLFGREGN